MFSQTFLLRKPSSFLWESWWMRPRQAMVGTRNPRKSVGPGEEDNGVVSSRSSPSFPRGLASPCLSFSPISFPTLGFKIPKEKWVFLVFTQFCDTILPCIAIFSNIECLHTKKSVSNEWNLWYQDSCGCCNNSGVFQITLLTKEAKLMCPCFHGQETPVEEFAFSALALWVICQKKPRMMMKTWAGFPKLGRKQLYLAFTLHWGRYITRWQCPLYLGL